MAELFADAADRSETAEATTAHEQQVGRFGRLPEDIDGRTIDPVDRQPLELLAFTDAASPAMTTRSCASNRVAR